MSSGSSGGNGSFKDHFSKQSAEYARYRPTYPRELFEFLAAHAPGRAVAWDVATGNGQAAVGLAEHFERVVATDASATQIQNAATHPKVRYAIARAEASGLSPASVDLVTVAQAAHWLELDGFYEEVRRVLRPGGVVAVWCYTWTVISPAIDRVLRDFALGAVGPYWPPERQKIWDEYRTLPFPFQPLAAPPFSMRMHWSLDDLMGYLSSWSSTVRYRQETGQDPLPGVFDQLLPLWGASRTETREVRWPLHLKVGVHPGKSTD